MLLFVLIVNVIFITISVFVFIFVAGGGVAPPAAYGLPAPNALRRVADVDVIVAAQIGVG